MVEKDREVVRLALKRGAKAKLDQVAIKRDMKIIGVLSRVVEWFAEQDFTLQSIVLGMVEDKDAPEVLGLIHKRLVERLVNKHLPLGTDAPPSESPKPDRKRKKKAPVS